MIKNTKAWHWAAENAATHRAARCHVKLWLVAHRIPELTRNRRDSSNTGLRPMATAKGIEIIFPMPRNSDG
jgi:hypothetical protein